MKPARICTRVLTYSDIDNRIATIEATVPDIKDAYESEDNHGDSCWHALVDWHPLAYEYGELRWMKDQR